MENLNLSTKRLNTQGKLEAARAAFDEVLTISRRLAEQDPSNAGWQHGLAIAIHRIATMASTSGLHDRAIGLLVEAMQILERVVELAPEQLDWKAELGQISSELLATKSHLAEGPSPQFSTENFETREINE